MALSGEDRMSWGTFLVTLNLTKVDYFLCGLYKTFLVLNYTILSLITVMHCYKTQPVIIPVK